MARWPISIAGLQAVLRRPLVPGGFSILALLGLALLISGWLGAVKFVVDVAAIVVGWSGHPWFGWIVILIAILMMLVGIRQAALAAEAETQRRRSIIAEFVQDLNAHTDASIATAIAIARHYEQSKRVDGLRVQLEDTQSILGAKEAALDELSKGTLAGETMLDGVSTNSLPSTVNELRDTMGIPERWRLPTHPPRIVAPHPEHLMFVVADNVETIQDWREDIQAAKREMEAFRQFVDEEQRLLNQLRV